MKLRTASILLAGCWALGVCAPAAAQQVPIEVTFEVPLNLTRLSSEVTRVRISCVLQSSALNQGRPGSSATTRRTVDLELPVSQGQVVQVAQVVFSFDPQELANASGKQALYECGLSAYVQLQSPPRFLWSQFSSHGVPELTPLPQLLSGVFVW